MKRSGERAGGWRQWRVAARGTLREALREPVLFIVVALLSLLWTGVEFNSHVERRRAIESARAVNENLARAFEFHVARVVEEIDNAVQALRWQIVASPDRPVDLKALTQQPGLSSRFVNQIGFIDSDGYVRKTWKGALSTPVDLRDRVHFTVHLDSDQDRLFISPPVIARTTRAWSVQLTRKVSGADGSFRGVLVASLDPLALSNVYASFDLGRTGSITLVGQDMIIRAQAPEARDMIGETLVDPDLRERLTSAGNGSYTRAEEDKDNALVSFRTVVGLPLTVLVSKRQSEILADVSEASARDRLAAAAVTLAVLVLTGVALRLRVRFASKSIRLKTTLRHMNQGIMIVESDGRLSLINQRAIDLLELPQDYLENPPSYREIFAFQLDRGEFGTGSKLVDKALFEALINHSPSEKLAVAERPRPNGTILEIHTMQLPGGGFIRSFTDITQRRRDEALIRSAMADLERFAHLASHDLQRPLRKIASHAALLVQSLAADDEIEARRCIDVITTAAQRGREMVVDLLRYSKLADKELKREPTSLDEMMRQLERDLRENGLGNDMRLSLQLPPMTVMCNGSLVFQVFQNLLDNAVKYRDPQRGIEIRVFGEDVEGGYLVHVADNGAGFDMAAKDMIFQPFKRLADARMAEGTGIGLSLVKSIVEKHGWTIDVYSEPGRGSDFFVAIPARDILSEAQARSRAAA